MNEFSSLSVHFAPLIGNMPLIIMAAIALALLVLSLFIYRRGIIWRTLAAGAFLLVLANPVLLEEKREPAGDVAVIVVDQSPSQKIGQRDEHTQQALNELKTTLADIEGLETRVINAPQENSVLAEQTQLFSALEKTLSDVPETRRAGVFFITDGQVHDIPSDPAKLTSYGPLHTLLSGAKEEKDRQLEIIEAPAYGIVGQNVTATFQVKDTGNLGPRTATVIIRKNDRGPERLNVPVNEEVSVTLPVEHGGQNVFEIEALPVEDELSEVNNKTALVVNGVRDRLKVLLVSGQPHAGGRTWRNMLTSDPGVDLVHFTILREPNKLDATPQNELSLIAFPFRELFEIKLYDFDLIIFDRYRLNRILPSYYFSNIARYVQEGGALLVATGPDYATEYSIYNTSLDLVLPGQPTGEIIETAYRPDISDLGKYHPVTENLGWTDHKWGSWLRQIPLTPLSGDVIMSGVNNMPLLILSRIGEGRVAQLASDQIWLWSRGYKGGGPQAELLRRLIHWMMKEPELDENAMDIFQEGSTLRVRRRSLKQDELDIQVQRPDGSEETITLSRAEDQPYLTADLPIDQSGIYRFSDDRQTRFSVVGNLNAPEMTGMITTEDIMAPAARLTEASIRWLADDGVPNIRMLPPKRDYAGFNWAGLRRNDDYNVTGVQARPFLPAWLAIVLLIGAATWMWWREGRSS